ncbi:MULTISPECIES: fructose PTS transporter subunit IIA [Enterococcus]|uniref:PTS sugar transporter subunit IIA n=1 Tax=Enterococcus sp. AZ103 TaxID=2774628 RepID=UPI003F2824A2
MEIINAELIDLDIDATTKEEAIQALAKKIHRADRLNDYDGYYESVIAREELTTTGIGFGIAIPHGKSPHVKETTVAFGRLNQALDWKSLDETDVNVVFLLAVPEACQGNQHLKIIASLSRKLIHEDFRKTLQDAKNPSEILAVLNESLQAAVA